MSQFPMTVKGRDKLKQELEHLKRVERPAVIKAISEARAHGDLKENAEYHAAKEKQSLIEGKINYIENKLNHAHIIDISSIKNEGKVIFGSTVTLSELDNAGKAFKYQIVGEDEADIKHHKISVTSPIARAIIGKYQGEEVEVKTPQGELTYEITQVEYL